MENRQREIRAKINFAFMMGSALRTIEFQCGQSIRTENKRPRAPLAPEVFWIYYLGTLLYWLYDSSEDNLTDYLNESKNLFRTKGMLADLIFVARAP